MEARHQVADRGAVLVGGTAFGPPGLAEEGEGEPRREDAVVDLGPEVPLVQIDRRGRWGRMRPTPSDALAGALRRPPRGERLAAHDQSHLALAPGHPFGSTVEEALG